MAIDLQSIIRNNVYMKLTFTYSILCLSIVLFSAFETSDLKIGKKFSFEILTDSFIVINGSSNINSFSCKAIRPAETSPLNLQILPDYSVDMNGFLKVNVAEFDCKNRILNNDLRKTLKENEYKQMTVHFKSLDQLPMDSSQESTTNGNILIELAGIKKEFKIPLVILKTKEGHYKLKGNRRFSFDDFNLKPPHKVAGIIRVKNEFNTVFVLKIKQK